MVVSGGGYAGAEVDGQQERSARAVQAAAAHRPAHAAAAPAAAAAEGYAAKWIQDQHLQWYVFNGGRAMIIQVDHPSVFISQSSIVIFRFQCKQACVICSTSPHFLMNLKL